MCSSDPSLYYQIYMQGRFEILSLCGSFLLSENSGQRSRTGGLSVSLSSSDGRVLGGSVAGLLTAACPVQVRIICLFEAFPKQLISHVYARVCFRLMVWRTSAKQIYLLEDFLKSIRNFLILNAEHDQTINIIQLIHILRSNGHRFLDSKSFAGCCWELCCRWS